MSEKLSQAITVQPPELNLLAVLVLCSSVSSLLLSSLFVSGCSLTPEPLCLLHFSLDDDASPRLDGCFVVARRMGRRGKRGGEIRKTLHGRISGVTTKPKKKNRNGILLLSDAA